MGASGPLRPSIQKVPSCMRLCPFSTRHGLAALALLLGTASTAYSQQFIGGIKLGLSSSAFNGTTVIGEEFSAIARLSGGALVGYDFGNGFVAHAEALYVIKGGEGNSEFETIPIRGTFDLTYIEFPLLITYRFETRRRLHPKLFAGPSLGLNQDARVRYTARSGGPEFDNEVDLHNKKDWGIALGVGLEMDVGDQRLTFEIRSTQGQTNLRNSGRELNNQALSFLMGIQF